MSLIKAKETYNNLLKSGDLLDMFPMLEGVWQEDKEIFLEMYELNEGIIGKS
jgi:hypothetical protein